MAAGSDDAGLGAAMDALQGAVGGAPAAGPAPGPSPGGAPGHGPEADSDGPPPSAPAPAVPPRLRGQALTPPPGPQDLSLGAVAKGAWNNLPSSLASNVRQTLMPFLPQMWGQDVEGAKAIARGIGSKTGLLIPANAAQKAQDEAPLNAIGDMYKQRYGSLDNFLSTVKNDPVAPLSDAAALGSIAAGGEGLIPKGMGAVGDALSAATSVGKAARWADPTYAAARAAGAGANLVAKGAGSNLGRKVIGDAIGGTLGTAIPIPVVGPIIGAKIGERVAAKLIPHGGFGPGARAVGRGLARTLPAATAFSGTQPEPGAAPPSQSAGAPGPAAPAGPVSPEQAQVNDMLTALEASDGQPAGPSAGLQGQPPPGGAPLRPPRGAMYGHIADIATNAGANPTEVSTLQQIARVESSGNPGATSPSGRYHGLFQYADSQGDPTADTMRALGDLRKNEQKLKGMGVTPDAGALYVMHQQGSGGGPALLTAPPGTRAIDAISRYYGSRNMARQAIAHNIGINYRSADGEAQANAAAENMSAADFVNLWRNKLTGVPFAAGGRTGFAEGGNVVDMSEALLRRAEAHHKASQQATKPMLGLSDDTVAKALKLAQAGI